MKMHKPCSWLVCLGAIALMSVPAFADHMNARLKSVDVDAKTVTVIEGQKDYVYAVTDTTAFVNASGQTLAKGIASGDLRAGQRLSIEYTKQEDKSVASEIKLRDVGKSAPEAPK